MRRIAVVVEWGVSFSQEAIAAVEEAVDEHIAEREAAGEDGPSWMCDIRYAIVSQHHVMTRWRVLVWPVWRATRDIFARRDLPAMVDAVSDDMIDALPITRHDYHGEWKYRIVMRHAGPT